MPLDSSTPLTITGVIATILSVIFAMASYLNSQKRQKAKVAKMAAAAAPKPSNEPKHTHIVIPVESPFPPPAPEPVRPEPVMAVAKTDRGAPPAAHPGGPPSAAVFKQFIARPGVPAAAVNKKKAGPSDTPGNDNDYAWE